MHQQLDHAWVILVIAALTSVLTRGEALAESTFVVNYDNTALTGDMRFTPDYQVGSAATISAFSTAGNETVDAPAGDGTMPGLSAAYAMPSGAGSLDISRGRDGLRYSALPVGIINRSQGTAEAFFRTPYTIASNNEPRAFLSAWVTYTSGQRWCWELITDATYPNKLRLQFGDNSNGKSAVITTPALNASDWTAGDRHHVVVTWKVNPGASNDVIRLFIDGRLMASTSSADLTVNTDVTESSNTVYVGMTSSGTGATNTGQGRNLEGWVDGVRIDSLDMYDGGDFTPPAAQSWRILRPFNLSGISWTASYGAAPVSKSLDHRTIGWEFTTDNMSTVPNGGRANWDWVDGAPQDLSDMVSVTGWLYVSNAAAVKSMTLYFRSGSISNWYGGSLGFVCEGWNHFSINKSQFGPTGSPSWSNIDGVRISVWKKDNATGVAKVEVYDIEATLQDKKQRPFEYPEYDQAPSPGRMVRREPNTNTLLETRMIMDENPRYLTDGHTTVLSRIASANFNAFAPCVWHGGGAIYQPTTGTAKDPAFASYFQGNDPLADLIASAHARNPRIAVLGWFTVGYRKGNFLSQYAPAGTPSGFFEMQDPAFRDFIVNEIVEFAKAYDVDGIVLDFIRTGGVSTSSTARANYIARYGSGPPTFDDITSPPLTQAETDRLHDWQDYAVSDIVKRVREGIRLSRPTMVIVTCGDPVEAGVWSGEGRNEWKWVQNDWIDVAYHMDYFAGGEMGGFGRAVASSPFPWRFAKVLADYDDIDGQIASRDAGLMSRQIDYFLKRCGHRGAGVYLYSMLSDDQIDALSDSGAGVFKEEALAFFTLTDDFEAKAVGNSVTAGDARWQAYTGSATVVSSPVASHTGSTRSVKFADGASGNQIFWFWMPTISSPSMNRETASVDFDVYVDNRNSAGDVVFEVYPSTGTSSQREVALQIFQPTKTTWQLKVLTSSGSTAYGPSQAVKTWKRIKFRNDIKNKTYTLMLDNTVLADKVAYSTPIQELSTLSNFQFRNLSNNEDVCIDNVVVQGP